MLHHMVATKEITTVNRTVNRTIRTVNRTIRTVNRTVNQTIRTVNRTIIDRITATMEADLLTMILELGTVL